MFRNSSPRKVPLSPWALLVVLVIGLVLGAASFLAYRSESQALEKQALADLQAIAQLKADGINREMADQRNRTVVLSRAPLFIDFMSRPQSSIPAAQRARTIGFMQETRSHAELDNVVLLDTAGARLAAADDAIPDKPEWPAAVAQAIESGNPVFIDFRTDPYDAFVDMSIIAPVYTAADAPRQALGAVALDITAANVVGRSLGSWPGATTSGEARLIRRNASGVLSLRQTGDVGPNAMELKALAARPDGIIDRILGGATVPMVATDRNGVVQLAASAPITGTDWFVVTTSRRDQALGEATGLGIGAGALTIAAIVIAIVVALLVEQRRRLHLALAEMRRRETVQAAEEQLRAVFEQASIGIALVTPDSRFLRINRRFCEMFGYSEAEFLDINPLDLMETKEDRESSAAFLRSLRSGVIDDFSQEKRYRRKDGSNFWGHVSVRAVRKPDASPAYFITVLEDMSESRRQAEALRQRENELHHAQKMEAIGSLTGGMAHDFNNLLGVIIGNLDLARAEVEGADNTIELIDDATAAAMRGAELTRQLLAFARRQPLAPREVALNEMIGDVAKLLRRTLGEDIRIVLDVRPETWSVRVDASQLETALLNLANNARDAMPDGGVLRLATANKVLTPAEASALNPETVPGDYALIEIADSGSGMTPEVAARIFEPFFTTKMAGKGTGLGLSMVFGFIKQSGGQVAVESKPGSGTIFRLYLPRAAGAEARAARSEASAPHRGAGETILAVEDNPAMRNLVSRQLASLGYRVLLAADPEEALRLLEREKVDLVFSDIVMPGKIDGFGLANQLQARWPKLKVILTSGFPDTKHDRNKDPARILSKPYRKDELARVLRDTLDA